jgi:ABC-type proline/glycine betaine transport system permease subunit
LTDLAEIDKFVKEQAEAIPLGEAEVLYWLEKPAAMLLTATQMRSSGMRSCGKAKANGRR